MTQPDAPAVHPTGSCACGAVAYRIEGDLRNVWNCHCEPCRRFTGHHMAATAAAVGDVVFTADETLQWWERVEGVEYGFCSRCGSSMFWRAADKPEHLSICAGTVDQPTGLETDGILFADEVSDYHALTEGIPSWSLDRNSKPNSGHLP